ncbi:MAG TPA: flagellar hook protein FlgE [Steroidobacteraceae bacterium]|jgi:flagellar hook protein FlgE|nr:flagellar hook protein FlgE [Steroidobacteraceae bacterium]
MPFRLALSGLNAAQADLTVTANNIANTATNGFKGSRAEFAELFSVSPQGVSSNAIGNGVRVSNVAQQFTQGNIDFTDNSLDLALSGQGFFILNDGGALAYTRAGAFQVDAQGYIVNARNQRLQVYPPSTNGQFNTGALSDIQLVTSESAPAATTAVDVTLNLAANATPPAVATFDPANVNSYNNATSLTTYDSLGAAHTATLYFTKTTNVNEWTTRLYVDGNAVGGAQTLQYNNSGTLTAPVGGTIAFPAYTPATGAAAMNMTFDFGTSTQYGGAFNVNAITQDGYTTGRLIGIDIDSTGVVQARFTNGRSLALGQVALANFANPQGLQQLGDTNWAETFGSGQALRGQAGNSGFGLVQSGALESSNVDITEQLVNMITAQRNFQANAQMISTADAITQTIINIR